MKQTLQILRAELREVDTGRRALRSFGLVVGAVLLAVAGFILWRNSGSVTLAARVLAAVGGGLALVGLAAPGLLRPLYLPWMALALALGFVMTRVLLTAVFILVVTPIGLLMRLARRDPMHRRPDPEADSYWIRRTDAPRSRDHLERYF